ncbi:hypothetical protein AVEN_85716-1 [Araneus ventricosus]|uniref:Uncharacterized protein n=1 Tax=Araneus ventricosus TaxID=182803 RepID=A0A4Y2QK89_ARAVE|nr:hypothetical protein AVEN_85716-1 [Araneus ventricosus]
MDSSAPFLLTTGGGKYEWKALHLSLSPKCPFNNHSPNCLLPPLGTKPAEILPTSIEVTWPVTAGLGVRVSSTASKTEKRKMVARLRLKCCWRRGFPFLN